MKNFLLERAFALLQPFLLHKDAETAHLRTLKALKLLQSPLSHILFSADRAEKADKEYIKIAGLNFPNRVGIAAGFDKNAEAVDALFTLGFGFVEIGTVTPFPQIGNPQPRLFRLPEDRAVINRMGFNNEGAHIAARRLAKRKSNGIVGVNVGTNKDTEDKTADYAKCVDILAPYADYFTLNVSSPNTPGLRDLQTEEHLKKIFDTVFDVVARKNTGKTQPIFIKFAPDLTEEEIKILAQTVNHSPIAGVIATNTLLNRPILNNKIHAQEAGGLSGAPIFTAAQQAADHFKTYLHKDKILIRAGGIDTADKARTALNCGADLIQIYTGFVYGGLRLLYDLLSVKA